MTIPDYPISRSINLAFNVGVALFVPSLRVDRAIFGDKRAYAGAAVGVESELPPSGKLPVPLIRKRAPRPSGPILPPVGHAGARPGERWFFINGILADPSMATKNAQALSHLFHRPVTILYNATGGLLPDLLESAAGKGFEAVTDSAANNLEPLVDALVQDAVQRVVVISHSQGTIIAAVLLKALQELLAHRHAKRASVHSGAGAQKESPERRSARRVAGTSRSGTQPKAALSAARKARDLLTPEHVGKLELYCFANCATSMAPIVVLGEPPAHAPWIESYGNEYDLVARFGVLAPPHGIGSARIEGDRYRRAGMWGHLLNAHYLIPLACDLEKRGLRGHELTPLGPNLDREPRLCSYYRGATPESYLPDT